jgi:hypothetical protein
VSLIKLTRRGDVVTCQYGRHVASFTAEPWMTHEELLDRARYEFLSLGVTIRYDKPSPPLRREDVS